MQPVRSIALGVLSLQRNAEGNLKTHVLRRKRGSACVFGRTKWIKSLGTCALFLLILFTFIIAFLNYTKSITSMVRENSGVFLEKKLNH